MAHIVNLITTAACMACCCLGVAQAQDSEAKDERSTISKLILWSNHIEEQGKHITIPVTIVTRNISDKVILHPPAPHACSLTFYRSFIEEDTEREDIESMMHIGGEMLISEFPAGYSRVNPGKSFTFDKLFLVNKRYFHILMETSRVSVFLMWDIRDERGNGLNGAPPKDAEGSYINMYAPFELPFDILDAPGNDDQQDGESGQ